MRAVDCFMFSAAKASERASERSLSLRPTTGTGNEKRRVEFNLPGFCKNSSTKTPVGGVRRKFYDPAPPKTEQFASV